MTIHYVPATSAWHLVFPNKNNVAWLSPVVAWGIDSDEPDSPPWAITVTGANPSGDYSALVGPDGAVQEAWWSGTRWEFKAFPDLATYLKDAELLPPGTVVEGAT